MVPTEDHQYMGIIWLLQHFQWIWVGMFVADNESGEHFVQMMETLFSQNGICSAFVQGIPLQPNLDDTNETITKVILKIFEPLTNEKAIACIIYGDSVTMAWLRTIVFLIDPENIGYWMYRKVWITTTQIDFVLPGPQKLWDCLLYTSPSPRD